MVLWLYQFLNSFSTLILAALGLAIIFGMMGIINLAHGEFIMLGAIATTSISALTGLPFLIAILLGAAFTGLIGFLLDRVLIRHLYSRTLDSVVATWGISLVIKQLASMWAQAQFGNNVPGIAIPLGTLSVGGFSMSVYKLVLAVIAVALVLAVLWFFQHTRLVMLSRATMQNSQIAESLGVNTGRVYGFTFMLGSFLAGLAGGLFSPLFTVNAEFGTNYFMPSFVTVLVGGASPLIGTIFSALSLGIVESSLITAFTTLFGQIGMLLFAIVFIRFFPKGFTQMLETLSQKHQRRLRLKQSVERHENA